MKYTKLSAEEKAVIEDRSTEAPFSGQYNEFFEKGVYVCKRCNAPLFKSDDKFRSDCGWPAFEDAIQGAIKQVKDADGMHTEIICKTCGAHLGHVFEGEELTPKNTRHCVNSISLKFLPEHGQSKNN